MEVGRMDMDNGSELIYIDIHKLKLYVIYFENIMGLFKCRFLNLDHSSLKQEVVMPSFPT